MFSSSNLQRHACYITVRFVDTTHFDLVVTDFLFTVRYEYEYE